MIFHNYIIADKNTKKTITFTKIQKFLSIVTLHLNLVSLLNILYYEKTLYLHPQ